MKRRISEHDASTQLEILRAPAYATVQDGGRRGFLDNGVPRSGAMDLATLFTLNALLGNDPGSAAIEWALSAGTIRFDSAVTFAIGGAECDAHCGDRMVDAYRAHRANPGDTLTIGAPARGRFVYLAFSGGISSPAVMGSQSTYVPGSFGGIDGRRLKSGDRIPLATHMKRTKHQVADALPLELRPAGGNTIRMIERAEVTGGSLAGEYIVEPASDRTGYRLGSSRSREGTSVTSEPVCPGVIQLPPNGAPIVLMADAPTIGGYLVTGCIVAADLGLLAQQVPGAAVTLVPVSVQEAQRDLRSAADRITAVQEWSLG